MPRHFRARKIYGESKDQSCPFCGAFATTQNEQGLYVCRQHKTQKLQEIQCECKGWLEARSGKFGPYFHCLNCGNVNYEKAMEYKAKMKEQQKPASSSSFGVSLNTTFSKERSFSSSQYASSMSRTRKKEPREIEITTDDIEYFS